LLLLLLLFYCLFRYLIMLHGHKCRCIDDGRLRYSLGLYRGIRIMLESLSQKFIYDGLVINFLVWSQVIILRDI